MMSVKKIVVLASVVLMLLLSGCTMLSGDDLLALPKLPEEYVKLQEKLDKIISEGSTYAVAESGTNRQAVQFKDLDGDGNEEAVAFFRAESGLYRIYVFRESQGDYILTGHAEGAGAYINSIDYLNKDTSGGQAIAVSWAFDDVYSYGLTVFGLAEEGLVSLLEKQYAFMVNEDITGDSVQDFLFVTLDNGTETYYLDVYSFGEDKPVCMYSAALCKEIRSVVSMQCSTGGIYPVIYIDSLATGGGYVTDMVTLSGLQAVNHTIDAATGSGLVTWRNLSVTCTDIDGDGILEIPSAYSPGAESSTTDLNYRLSWDTYNQGARERNRAVTFHNPSENWYIFWPDEWDDDVHAARASYSTMTAVTFYVKDGLENIGADPENSENFVDNGAPPEVATIYVLNSDSRLSYMLKQGMKIIRQINGQIYGYIINENAGETGYLPKDFASLINFTDNRN